MSEGSVTFGEPVSPGFDHVFQGRLLHRERSAFQTVEVYDHEGFGRMLLLDGVVQTTERDEFCYHEMLVHPALCALERAERVLIVGGGDGGTLRRVLSHDPAEAVLCEIDEAVVRVSREYLPGVSDGALDDPRARLVFEDGADFVGSHDDAFDAVVVDSTDPVGPGAVLFSEGFYASCRRALRPGGVVVAQTGSPFYQSGELRSALGNLASAFPSVELHTGHVPTYPGQLWTYASATDGPPASSVPAADIRRRLDDRGIETRYYTPELHAAAFALPAFLRRVVDEAREQAEEPGGSSQAEEPVG